MTKLLIYSKFNPIQVGYISLPDFSRGNYLKSCPAVLIFDFPARHHLHLLEPLGGFAIHWQTVLIFNLKKKENVCLFNYMYDYSSIVQWRNYWLL